jgi:RNA polymerase sigma-70 factor, ECF subfamily
MLRFQAGDQGAFEELVRRNAGKIHGLVYRFLGGPSLVEDITQEVFLRIHRTAPRYQPSAKFSTWLYRIVANLCFNAMRSRRKGHDRQMRWTDDEDAEAFFGSLPDVRRPGPTQLLDQAELQQRVAEAVAGLPENQRVAIVLNKFEGKSYDEIAEVLECSGMAVKSLLSRARRNLRTSLGGYVRPGGE